MANILPGLILGIGIFLMVYGYARYKQASGYDALAAAQLPADKGSAADKGAAAQPNVRRRLLLRIRRWCMLLARELEWLPQPLDLPQRLAWAGKERMLTPLDFRGDQVLYMLGMGLLGIVYGLNRRNEGLALGLGLVLGAIGLYLPIYLLHRQAKQRQAEITLALPNAVDLISAAVLAGLPIDRALTYAAENIPGALGEELSTFLQELKLGMPRVDAYRRLIWRNNSDEMHIIIGALLQGQTLGAPVAETLASQAESMRERRLQRAKEAGAKASPRISLVMIACIIPSIFLMFAAMMAYSIFRGSGSLFSFLGG